MTDIVDLVDLTLIYGIQQMEMRDKSLIHKMNSLFIAFMPTGNHLDLSAWKTGDFTVPPEFGPAGWS